jgi:hypothetical protein
MTGTRFTLLLVFTGCVALAMAAWQALSATTVADVRAADVLRRLGLGLLALGLLLVLVDHVTPLLDAWTHNATDPLGGVR